MLVRVSSLALRICGALALILGLTVWIVPSLGGGLVMVHMLLGLLVVISLWLLSFAGLKFNTGLAIGGFVLGLIVLLYGGGQEQILAATSTNAVLFNTIKVVHLLLGAGAIGLGESIARRARAAGK